LPFPALRGAALTRAALAFSVLLLAFALSARAAQAVTPSYGVTVGGATLTPVDLGTATPVFGTGEDDAIAVVAAPFPVSLYGVTSSSLSVDTNGYVGVGADTIQRSGSTDVADFGTPVVAAFNGDLDTVTDGDVVAEERGVAPDRQFVIQWDVAAHGVSTTATARFQIIFNEDNADVEVDYGGTLDLGRNGWVGAKLDPSEFVRSGDEASPYPAYGTAVTYSPNTMHLTAAVPARGDAAPTITGSTADMADDVQLAVYAGTTAGTLVQTTTATPNPSTGEYTKTLPTPLTDDGDYVVVASQPADGHAKTHETFTVDTTGPAGLTFDGPTGTSNQAEPTFTGDAGTAADDQQPTVEIYDGTTVAGGSLVEIVTTTGTPAWSGTSDGLDDGTYTARAVQVDDLGNETDSTPTTFTVDTESPSPFFSQTPPTQGSAPFFTGFGSSDVGDDATVTVAIFAGSTATGSPVQQYGGVALDGDGRFTVEATALAEGVYTARVSQGDDAGNADGIDLYTFTVDATAPTLTMTTPADGTQTTETTPLFSGTAGRAAGDNDSVGVGIFAGSDMTSEPVAYVDAPIAADGTWSGRPNVALPVGTYTVEAYLYDDANNSTVVLHTLTVVAPPAATPAPAPVVVPAPAPKPAPVVVCKSTRLLHRHLDRPSGTHLKVTATLNGKKVKSTINRSGISVTVDLRGKGKGTYKLRVITTRKQATGKHKTITSTRTFTYKVCL
jgi:hypothetical protein